MEAEFAREVLSRLPLAEAVLSLWRWVADPLFLLSVFARHRGQGYEKEIRFEVLVAADRRCVVRASGQWEEEFCARPRTRAAHRQCAGGISEVGPHALGIE